MKMTQTNICIKSGLPISNPSICSMCRRSCRLAGSRGRRYTKSRSPKFARKPLLQ